MKNKISCVLVAAFIAAAITSCKKDKKEDACAKVELKQKASINYTKPCGMAVSKSGIVAVVQYNGFNAYGSPGTTTIWKSYTDFLENKAPLQSFSSTGAEVAAFDNDENLYISETEATAGIRIYKKIVLGGGVRYDPWSLIQGNNIPGGFNNPRGLAFDAAGRLYIANDGVKNLIRVLDPMTNPQVQILTGEIGAIKGLAISGGFLFITIYDEDLVLKCTLRANGDFDTIVGIYRVTKPVDIAVKDGLLAVNSPESGTLSLIDPDKMGKATEEYTGCKKEIHIGTNIFGLAFNPLTGGLFVAHLDENRVLYFEH